MSISIEGRNLLIVKAREKRDGIYTFRGLVYRVKDKAPTHYAYNGLIYEMQGVFDVLVGSYLYQSDLKRQLRALR